MTIGSHLTTFAGLPVVAADTDEPVDPAAVAWRVEVTEFDLPPHEFEAAFEGALGRVLARTGAGGPVALLLGEWGGAYERPAPLDLLVRHAGRLSGLRSLFVGEMTFEQCEISWIQQGDITPLLAAFPRLERLWIRGAEGLHLERVRHTGLTELVFQSGGLPPAVVRTVAGCDLPRLEHLELWLGVEDYGGGATPDDLAELLSGRVLPVLRRLGLCNAENADEIAAAVAAAPVVARLTELDLSKGTLGDAGAEALLAGQPLDHLRLLDLSHHFISPEVVQRLAGALPGVHVDVSEALTAERWGRYTTVSE